MKKTNFTILFTTALLAQSALAGKVKFSTSRFVAQPESLRDFSSAGIKKLGELRILAEKSQSGVLVRGKDGLPLLTDAKSVAMISDGKIYSGHMNSTDSHIVVSEYNLVTRNRQAYKTQVTEIHNFSPEQNPRTDVKQLYDAQELGRGTEIHVIDSYSFANSPTDPKEHLTSIPEQQIEIHKNGMKNSEYSLSISQVSRRVIQIAGSNIKDGLYRPHTFLLPDHVKGNPITVQGELDGSVFTVYTDAGYTYKFPLRLIEGESAKPFKKRLIADDSTEPPQKLDLSSIAANVEHFHAKGSRKASAQKSAQRLDAMGANAPQTAGATN